MEETVTNVPNTSASSTSTHSETVHQTIPSPRVCKVCGGPARYSCFGAVVCHSCKLFFKRNAQTQPVPFKCNSGDHCEIDVNTRRICPSCRLAKSFASGMTVEMIRSGHAKKNKKTRKNQSTTNSTSTALVRLTEGNQPERLPALNLLQADQSTLSVDQWNHLSNVVHCFDEYSGLSFIQHFIDEQTALPPKFRFRFVSVNNFFTSMMAKVQLVFEKNRDYLSLSLHDRSTLLRSTVEYTTGIGGAFLLRQAQLLDNPAFYESAELILRPAAVTLFKRLIDQFDPDITFMKILFAAISFLMSNYTVYASTPATKLTDAKAILGVQDMYTDLVWRYLLYKHNHHHAVLCFSNLLRCLLLVNDSVVEAHEVQQFTDIMDSVVESTEQKLVLNS